MRRLSLVFIAALLVVHGSARAQTQPAPKPPAPQATKASRGATVAEARKFIADAEARLLELWVKSSRADWVQATYITDDTEKLAADAQAEVIAVTTQLATEATRFDKLKLPSEMRRKLTLLKLSLTLPAPRNPKERDELVEIAASLQSDYGKGKYCPPSAQKESGKLKEKGGEDGCLDINELSNLMAENRDPAQLLEAWAGWHAIAPPMRERYTRYVVLANKGARELGFADVGAMWRSNYDMPPAEFAKEVDRLWEQVKPLYDALHVHVRGKLSQAYGKEVVAPNAPIPAHVLGNMWAQQWGNVHALVAPPSKEPTYNLSAILKEKKIDEREMVRYGERFFTSLGFAPLPKTFWERSLFVQPRDRDVVCHASAWDVDSKEDLRIKMCIQINEEDFGVIHHELGHNFYQRAYNKQPPLFLNSANDGFHEALGDTVALSITPEYLHQIKLLDKVPEESGDLDLLMRVALDKVAFLPFGLLIDQWRWKVFSGEITPANYNKAWWELRRKYQGVAAPVGRSEKDFDPGAKYHVPANVPYTRYFLAHILQFQFFRALCKEAGYTGPLHRCSIYGNKAAGAKLQAMMEMGLSRPWPEALEKLTGEKQMDATAILDYFAPLKKWLDEENKKNNRKIGW